MHYFFLRVCHLSVTSVAVCGGAEGDVAFFTCNPVLGSVPRVGVLPRTKLLPTHTHTLFYVFDGVELTKQ